MKNYVSRIRHGMSNTRIYNIWRSMRGRCYNTNDYGYATYGGRGIKVCDRWNECFENFFNDVKEGYRGNLSLDRIDNDGDYEPANIRWATAKEQANNRRNTIFLTFNGRTECISKWSEITGTKIETISTRYFKNWSDEECIYGRNIEKLN
jgi:hypothetical protein